MTVELRELEWTDVATLAAMELDLFSDDAWSEQSWWAELAGRPRRDYVVAVEGERIVGYGGIDVAGDVADLMTIATTSTARGTGLGARLLEELVLRAEQAGAEALVLEVRADNEPAKRLYDRHGFEVISVRRRYYQPGDIDALVMRKHIGGTHG